MLILIGLKYFRHNISEIEERAALGEKFLVLRRNQPIFMVTAPSPVSKFERHGRHSRQQSKMRPKSRIKIKIR